MYYKVGDEVLAAVKICKVDSKAEDARKHLNENEEGLYE
jgi:hypothetical protein